MCQKLKWHVNLPNGSDSWYITFVRLKSLMCGPAPEYTFQDFLNDAYDEEWVEWEKKAAELEIPLDYYIQEFV